MDKVKTAVVTGAGSGIGKDLAILLRDNGYKVYSLFRSAEDNKVEKKDNNIIINRACDVTDEQSIKRAISDIDYIDILVHCAGTGIAGSAECVSNQDAHSQFDVNFFGVLNVNRLAMEKVRKSNEKKVFIIGSVGGRFPLPYQGHYCASKYALEGYTGALNIESSVFGVKCVMIEPGDVHTDFTKNRKVTEPSSSIYLPHLKNSLEQMEKDEINGYTSYSVAKKIFCITQKKNPRPRYVVGFKYKALLFISRFASDRFILNVIKGMYKTK